MHRLAVAKFKKCKVSIASLSHYAIFEVNFYLPFFCETIFNSVLMNSEKLSEVRGNAAQPSVKQAERKRVTVEHTTAVTLSQGGRKQSNLREPERRKR